MNKQEQFFKRNRLLQSIKHLDRYGNKEGFVKIYSNNSEKHENTKFQIAHKLKKLGFEIWSECRFEGGGKGDLIAIKDGRGWIVEIETPKSEKEMETKLNQKANYPIEFELIVVKTDELNIRKFEL